MNRRTRVGAYAVAEQSKRLLLVRVSPGNRDEGMWTLPGGGIEFGEQPDEALHRELYEETGLQGTIIEPLGADSVHLPAISGHEELHWIRVYYRVDVAGEPRVTEVGGSVDEAAWYNVESLPDIDELVECGLARLGLP